MKTSKKIVLYLIIPVVMIGILVFSCSKDELGAPSITYVRVTKPSASDSLLGSGLLGNLIVVVGQNLGSTREIWFNDKPAVLNPVYITNTTILVSIPSGSPAQVNNQMKLVFANGQTLEYPFVIKIPAPELTSMPNEWPAEGDSAILKGNYFFEPISVKYSDGTPIIYASLSQTEIKFIVPPVAPSGPITVTTNFGTVTSTTFAFRDKRGLFASMDSSAQNWWHGSNYITTDPNVPAIAKKYMVLNSNFGAYPYYEFMVGPVGSGMELGTKNIPDRAILQPEEYNMKMEILTEAPLAAGSTFQLYIGNDMPNERNTAGYYYTWTPVIDTKGKWQTISLPFAAVLFPSAGKKVVPKTDGYDISFIVHGNANPFVGHFAYDNVRVVPNK